MKAAPTRAMATALALEPAANAVLLARAFAQMKREEVDTVKREVLTASPYMVEPEHQEDGRPERITEPRLDWLMTTADHIEYCASLNQIERARGIKPAGMPDEHCPALVAESLLIDAEWLLIEQAWPLVAPDQGADGWKGLYGDARKKFLDLLCKVVVNRPGYRRPEVRP